MAPIDAEAKKITKWADTGDRTDPDDSSLTPALVRANGWPAVFSATNGETIRRRVANQLFCELSALAVDQIETGVLPWDGDVDYLVDAVVQADSNLLARRRGHRSRSR